MNNKAFFCFLFVLGLIAAYWVGLAATPIAQARGDARQHSIIGMFLVGVLGLVYGSYKRHLPRISKAGLKIQWLVFLLPTYAFFQVLPLPIQIMRVISPSRAALWDALNPIFSSSSWIPLSVAPTTTMYHALLFAACAVVFSIVYQLAVRPWTVVIPLIVIAVAEAGIGLAQVAYNPESVATGTYIVRNHYAGLLEMILPFPAVYSIARLRHVSSNNENAVLVSMGLGVTALIMAAITFSLSRMGFIVSSASMIFVGIIALRHQSWRHSGVALATVLVVALLAFLLLPPVRLILRFAEVNQDSRAPVWGETLALISAYPTFGCGLGGYESAFSKFKLSGPTLTQDYAHSDYLQYLAELGVIGFVTFATPVVVILAGLLRTLAQFPSDLRWLGIACTSSLAAIGFHAFVDFNLYVPANMMVFSWILAIAAYVGMASNQHARTATSPL